jgi:succinoglycan biosynthesis transport protein ExoP
MQGQLGSVVGIGAPIGSVFGPLSGEQVEAASDVGSIIRSTWAAVYRNRILIGFIVCFILLTGIVITMLQTKEYSASATVQIDQQASKVLGTEDVAPDSASYQDADRFLQTQVDILNSRSLAEQVAISLNLSNNDDFIRRMGLTPRSEAVGSLTLTESKHEQILNVLENNLTVLLPRNSRVVSISFRSREPRLAMKIANSFANNFILLNLKRKYDQSTYARNFLQQQLSAAKQRLEDSEVAALNYSRLVGLIDASAGIGATDNGESANAPRSLVTSDLVALNTSLSAAQAARVQAEQRWAQARTTPLLNLPEVLANPTIQGLTQLKVQLQAAYDQDSTRHKSDFPAAQQLKAQIAGYDVQIERLASGILSAIHDQYSTALRQENALSNSVDALKLQTLTEQEKSVRYNILKRETDTNRTMYDGLLQRYKEVSAEAGIASNNLAIVDTAEVPVKPVSPKVLLNLGGALAIGVILAALIVVLREKFDDSVKSPDDVSSKLGLALLNTVPLLESGASPVTELNTARSSLSEAYAALRTAIELASAEENLGTILFTSSRSGEGKSTSAYAIARDFARLGRRVVLIDGDLRRPSLHKTLGIDNSVGLSQLLARQKELSEVIRPTGSASLSIISTGPLPPSPVELLSAPTLKKAIVELKGIFDVVIIDGPPVLGLADAVILANAADHSIFVIEANGAHHGAAKAAIKRLRSAGAPILGALLTKFDSKKLGYGYSYGYYSYDYGTPSKVDSK